MSSAQRTAVKQRPHQETETCQSQRASPWYSTTGEREALISDNYFCRPCCLTS